MQRELEKIDPTALMLLPWIFAALATVSAILALRAIYKGDVASGTLACALFFFVRTLRLPSSNRQRQGFRN